MNSLGWAYENGTGVAKDEAKAVELYKKAAELGNDIAMVNLGWAYARGNGITKDVVTAFEWYKKAVELGNPKGMYNLGVMYEYGRGVTKDEIKAVEWYNKAIELGNTNAMHNLGVLYGDGRGVAKDEIKAAELFKKAAELGNGDAAYNLGIMYRNGRGVAKDEAKARELFKKSADLGSGTAMAKIGSLYKDGDGVTKDNEEALRWLYKAIVADPDYDWSYRGIAEIYNDRGDKDKYHEWNLKAAEKGSGVAMASLGEQSLGKYGSNSYDANKAAEWFLKALATDKDSSSFTDNSETGKQRAKRILDELKATGKITDLALLKQVNAIFDPAPSLKWISIPKTINTQTLDVSVEANDQGGGIGDVQIFVDGKVVSNSDNRSLKKAGANSVRNFKLNLPSGEHTIKIRAFSAENQGNYTDIESKVTSAYAIVKKPKLHMVVIGINEYQQKDFNLKSAVADAKAVYNRLENQTKDGALYEKGGMYLLTTKSQTSKNNIKDTISQLREKAEFQDVFIFYVAAHGKALEDGYYMTTSDLPSGKERDIKATSLNEKDLKELLLSVPTQKKFAILDTCNAGSALKAEAIMSRSVPRDVEDTVEVLNTKAGVTILMSSQKAQEAIDEYKGHGLFTYVLLDAMNGKSSRDGKSVYSDDIMSHVEKEVPQIAQKVFKAEQSVYTSKGGQGFPLVMIEK
jgi:TPR repeat protein